LVAGCHPERSPARFAVPACPDEGRAVCAGAGRSEGSAVCVTQPLSFLDQFRQGFLMLRRLVALLDDNALGRRQADDRARTPTRFLGDFQLRFLAAGHSGDSIADAAARFSLAASRADRAPDPQREGHDRNRRRHQGRRRLDGRRSSRLRQHRRHDRHHHRFGRQPPRALKVPKCEINWHSPTQFVVIFESLWGFLPLNHNPYHFVAVV